MNFKIAFILMILLVYAPSTAKALKLFPPAGYSGSPTVPLSTGGYAALMDGRVVVKPR